MPVKGTIKADHIPLNSYTLVIGGMPTLTVLTMSGIEEELSVIELPDRTKASGGNTAAIEFDVTTPMHHDLEQAAWELWFKEGQDPVLPTYKKVGTLVMNTIGGGVGRTHTLMGVWVSKRGLPDLDMANEGEMATTSWTLQADDILPA